MPALASSSPGIAERLGGRWAISRTGFVISAIGLVASIAVGEDVASGGRDDAFAWLMVAAVAVGTYGAILLLLDRWTPYRDRRQRPVRPLVIAIGSITTASLVALAIGLTAEGMDLDTAQSLPIRVVGLVVVGSWFGLGLTLVLDEIDRSRTIQRRVIDQQVRVELARLQQSLLLEELRHEVQSEVDAVLEDARRELATRLQELEDAAVPPSAAATAAALRTMADETVRPLSAVLWRRDVPGHPRVEWTSVVASTFRHEPLRPVALALIHLVGGGWQTITRFGAGTGFSMLALTVVAIFGVCVPANALMRRYPSWHGRIFVAAIVLLEVQIVPLVVWRESIIPGSATVAWASTQVAAGILVILMTSGFGSWQQQRRAVARSYLQVLDRDLIVTMAQSRAVAELARELSRTLHGTVQSKLVACAMVSEQAIESGDVEQLRAALTQAQRVLATSSQPRDETHGIELEVRRKVALWDELCGFEVHCDPRVEARGAAQPNVHRVVGQVVEEGIGNAIRHGGATRIRVEVAVADEAGIRVVIADDGCGLVGTQAPGLGSVFLDRAGVWSLTDTGAGARLDVLITPR